MLGPLELPLSECAYLASVVTRARVARWRTNITYDARREVFAITHTNANGFEIHKLFGYALKAFELLGKHKDDGALSFRGIANYASFRTNQVPEEDIEWTLNQLIICGAVTTFEDRDRRNNEPLTKYKLVRPHNIA